MGIEALAIVLGAAAYNAQLAEEEEEELEAQEEAEAEEADWRARHPLATGSIDDDDD